MDDESIARLIGANVRRKRLEHGLTLEQVAGKLKISYQQVQKYERGKNSVSGEKLVKLAAIFRCPVDEFCGQGESPKEPEVELLVRHYRRIASPELKKMALDLMAEFARSKASFDKIPHHDY